MATVAKVFLLLILVVFAAFGLYQLVEAQAHGESAIPGLVLLATPLLVLGSVLVRAAGLFVGRWRGDGATGQKAVVGLLAAVLIGGGLYAYVESTVPSQRPSPELTAALGLACRGSAVAGAGSLDMSGSHSNHLVVLDTDGNEHAWTGYPSAEWRPQALSDAELVACVSAEETRTEIQLCDYVNGPPIHRYRVSRDVLVVEAATGRTVAHFAISDDPRECRASEEKDLTELSGELGWQMLADHCESLVSAGLYRPPTPTTGDQSTPPQPGTPSAKPTPPPSYPPSSTPIELAAAIDSGLVVATLHGDGLQNVRLDLESASDGMLTVHLPLGTMLEPARRAAQTMVVTSDMEIDLQPGESVTRDVPAACARMRKDEPNGDDRFTLADSPASGDLLLLLQADEYAQADGRIQQFAVWTITNDPARNRYVALGSAFVVFGTGPTDSEFAAIRELMAEAGIDPRDYRAFR